ncbi:hypothetical protein NQ315_012886 [Exocentrus adspersus]|uniref:Uncharacterized protein n=1 Tax=Exocentrus adspersus TaxID=1586481 RepID=A0AAV8VGF0_9CUCU|nr:hypothetical protein NQ315_012886 [Exocentrus adspersus]
MCIPRLKSELLFTEKFYILRRVAPSDIIFEANSVKVPAKTSENSDKKNEIKTTPNQAPNMTDVNSGKNVNINKRKTTDPNRKKNPITRNLGGKITTSEVANAVLQTEHQLKLDKYINIMRTKRYIHTSASEDRQSEPVNEVWKKVTNRKKRSTIIGSNKESSIKGVPKYMFLHVYRIDPNITCDDLLRMLATNIPEVTCEALTPKYPGCQSTILMQQTMSRIQPVHDSLFLYPYTEGELLSLLTSRLKGKHSTGFDEMPPFLIKKFRNLKYVLNQDQLLMLYYAQVESTLRYGICFWGASAYLESVFIAQKRIVRIIANI